MFSGDLERAQVSQKSVMKLEGLLVMAMIGRGLREEGTSRFQIFEPKHGFVNSLAVKGLTESPTSIYSSQCL